jgi:hypothetical protein
MVDKMRANVAKLLTVEIQAVKFGVVVAFAFGFVTGAVSISLILLLIRILGFTELVGRAI